MLGLCITATVYRNEFYCSSRILMCLGCPLFYVRKEKCFWSFNIEIGWLTFSDGLLLILTESLPHAKAFWVSRIALLPILCIRFLSDTTICWTTLMQRFDRRAMHLCGMKAGCIAWEYHSWFLAPCLALITSTLWFQGIMVNKSFFVVLVMLLIYSSNF